jgi:uncharacterized membrane protein YgdD (TMEM256/DUF423 family)
VLANVLLVPDDTMSLGTFYIFTFLLKGLVMKKFCVMMIAACMLAVSAANTTEASLLSKRIEGVKKIADLVGKTVMKTSGDAAKTVWNNKGAIGVATVATVALTNPEAATADVTGVADVVTNAVTGTADVAYGVVTGGKTAETVTPRSNVRQTTGWSIIPTLLYFLLFCGIGVVGISYFRRRIGVFRVAVPLLAVGVVLFCGVTAEASMLGTFPNIQCTAPVIAVKPIVNFIVLVITVASLFL